MSTPWLNTSDRNIIIDQDGKLVLCDACPCDEFGTGSPTLYPCCEITEIIPADLCVTIGGSGLIESLLGTGTGSGDVERELLIRVPITYDPVVGYWYNILPIYACVPGCVPNENFNPRVVGPVAEYGLNSLRLFVSLQCVGFTDPAIVIGVSFADPCNIFSGGVLPAFIQFSFQRSAGTFNCVPFYTGYVQGTITATPESCLWAKAEPSSCNNPDKFNVELAGCADFNTVIGPWTPRYMYIQPSIGNPLQNITISKGFTFGGTPFVVQPIIGGILKRTTGCTWYHEHTDSAVDVTLGINRNQDCGYNLLEIVRGRPRLTSVGYQGTASFDYSLTFVGGLGGPVLGTETGTGSGTGSGASVGDIWDESCADKLYYDGPGTTWTKSDGTYLSSSDYVMLRPFCGLDFTVCEQLTWPDTLFLTITSSCSFLNGLVIPLHRCSYGRTAQVENEFFAHFKPTNHPNVFLDVVIRQEVSLVLSTNRYDTADVKLYIYCTGSPGIFTSDCSFYGAFTPVLPGIREYEINLVSCDPFIMQSPATVGLTYPDNALCNSFLLATCSHGTSSTVSFTLSE